MENLIGLSQKACDCFDLDDTTSDSELWLDELEGLNLKMIDAGKYCEDLTDFMVRAKANAILKLREDILINLRDHYRPKYQPYIGYLGQQDYKKFISTDKDIVGIELCSKRIKGSRLKLKKIGININQTKTVTISIDKKYGEDDDNNSIIDSDFTQTIDIDAVANKWTLKTLDEPIYLDLWQDGYKELKYLLSYNPDGARYRDNQTSCGCGTKDNFIEQYITVSGIEGTLLNYNTTGDAHGIVLEVEIVCETDQIIDDNLTFSDFKLVTAHALRYKAGFLLVQSILSSPNGDTYTNVVNQDQLIANAKGYESEYQDRVKYWIPENIRFVNNDCYICSGTKRGKILS